MQSDFAPHSNVPSYRSIEQQPLELDEHREDHSNYWTKRLLAFIQAMFVLLLILVGLNFFTGLTSGHFSLVPFFPLLFLWIVLYIGHIGAHQRRTSFLQAFFVLNVLIICFVVASFILFPAALGTVLCSLDGGFSGGCSWNERKAIAHVTFIGILFAFIPCLPAAMGAIYAARARNEILMAKLRASIEEELGITLDRSSEERLGLLHAAPVGAPAQPHYYYHSYDYRPMVYVPNPPYFSSTTNNGPTNGNGSGSPQPVQFPVPPPASYYYYPPPPPRTAGLPSAPAPAPSGSGSSSPPAQAMPPSVPQGGDEKH